MRWFKSLFCDRVKAPAVLSLWDLRHGAEPAAAAGPLRGSRPLHRGGAVGGRPDGSQRIRLQGTLRPVLSRLLEDGEPGRVDGTARGVVSPGGAEVGSAGSLPVRHVRGYFHGALRCCAGLEVPLLSARTTWRVSLLTHPHTRTYTVIAILYQNYPQSQPS